MKVQLTLQQLKAIINSAEKELKVNNSFSDTIIIDVKKQTDLLNGGDNISIYLVSSYQDCNSKQIL